MYRLNSNGASTEPCGSPLPSIFGLLMLLPRMTCKVMLLSMSFMGVAVLWQEISRRICRLVLFKSAKGSVLEALIVSARYSLLFSRGFPTLSPPLKGRSARIAGCFECWVVNDCFDYGTG
ncbi:hypothetical protein JTB14_030810 [Gonioctena quinquepunctata]|nr:hypothetical protein JTB14_030810 [Gonioctena quinquepunctata]